MRTSRIDSSIGRVDGANLVPKPTKRIPNTGRRSLKAI